MKKYWAYTGRLAAATPESRNRVVDFWRVLAILMVVCGHWLAVTIWVKPDGSHRPAQLPGVGPLRRLGHLAVPGDAGVLPRRRATPTPGRWAG